MQETIKPIDKTATLNFLKSLKTGHKFEYRVSNATQTPTIIASATAVLAMSFLDELKNIPSTTKNDWAHYLLNSIDETGLVIDTMDYEMPTQSQPLWALKAHRTRHTAWAIEALGATLQHEIKFIKPYLTKTDIKKWLNEIWSMNWPGGFWQAGNWIMDMGVLLDLQYRHFACPAARETLIELLRLLTEKIEPQTGFWRGPGNDDRNAMAGSMHLYPLYWAYGQELPYFDKAVRLTLDMQQPDGLFGYQINHGGSQCLDYDAALILINGFELSNQFKNDITDSFRKVRSAIEVNRQPTGSWSDCLLDETRYWATAACAYNAAQGSIWDTYARIMTVGMCDRVLNDRSSDWFVSNHHIFEIFNAGAHWKDGTFTGN